MDQQKENQEYGFNRVCNGCGKEFKLIRKNTIQCGCLTKFWDVDKAIKQYEDKFLTCYTKQ